MTYRKYKSNRVINEANRIAFVWRENPDFHLGDIKLEDVSATIEQLNQLDDDIRSLRIDLTAKLNRRDEAARTLNAIVVRARSGIRGFFGPDSSQYEQAGGTRTSERKPRKRKAKPNADENSQ